MIQKLAQLFTIYVKMIKPTKQPVIALALGSDTSICLGVRRMSSFPRLINQFIATKNKFAYKF